MANKSYQIKNVLEASEERLNYVFDNFNKIYLSFSGGKDSTVMLHICAKIAKERNRKFGVLIVDLEGQYQFTIDHLSACIEEHKDLIEVFWCCLPIALRNAVSVFEPKWICWDKAKKENWIRPLPEGAISDESYFDFFQHGMEFEEFVPLFGEWYAKGEDCACLVGIRCDESLNRFRTIASRTKNTYKGNQWTTLVTQNVYNVYPIYDWKTQDIWTYHAKFPKEPCNELYEFMHKAGVPLSCQRICQPYGDDQRRGLWLFHLIEPNTWAKVVARVNGANSGALYVQENGNINGYNKITKPDNHTWQSFAELFVNSLPPKTQEHFQNKILLFLSWWKEKGYPDGVPDEAPLHLETNREVPSWRRVCKSLLRNDYWCKGLGFSQTKSDAYDKYLQRMKKKKTEIGITTATQLDLFLQTTLLNEGN
jgi:predicted phosphoadenosine phosphosulfate sulfurtransferase